MAANLPAITVAHKISQVGRPQCEHGAFAILENMQGLHIDVQALHVLKDGEGAMFTLWATYLTDFVRDGDGWKISRHELVIRGTQQTP